jgi:ribosome biogenesis GTPase
MGDDWQAVLPVRETDDKGRHTTTRRELFILPAGGLLIDTPGLRELQLWEGADGLEETFVDIETIAVGCRFTDCRHESEPGCAVRVAVAAGQLDPARLASFQKLRREVAQFERRNFSRVATETRSRTKSLSKHAPSSPKPRK